MKMVIGYFVAFDFKQERDQPAYLQAGDVPDYWAYTRCPHMHKSEKSARRCLHHQKLYHEDARLMAKWKVEEYEDRVVE